MRLSRREWLRATGGLATGWGFLGPALPRVLAHAAEGLSLGIGTYSLRGMTIEAGLKLLKQIGYSAVEIAAQPGMDAEPSRMPPERCAEVRQLLQETGLALTSIMENLVPAADAHKRSENLARLRQAMELGKKLAPAHPPLVQTILGGGAWEQKKSLLRDQLGEWVKAAQDMGVVLAIKPHRGQAMSRPGEAIWLIQQLGNSPWLRMVYDYGHYVFRDMPLAATVAESLPYTALIVVKDTIIDGQKTQYALPGETHTIDYPKLLRLFYDGGYRGDVCCEVSSQISSLPGYDPATTARTCYQNMAAAFRAAGIAQT